MATATKAKKTLQKTLLNVWLVTQHVTLRAIDMYLLSLHTAEKGCKTDYLISFEFNGRLLPDLLAGCSRLLKQNDL